MEERIGRELEKAAERMVDHAWESIFGDGIISENGERRTLPFTLNSNVTMEESYHFNIVTSMEIAMTDADGNSEPPLTMKMHFHLFSLLLLTFVLMNTNTVLNKTDENIYQVQPLKTAIEIDGDWDKEVWKKVEAIEIVHRMGADPAFIPKTKAKLLYDEEYIYGIFKVEDRYVQCKVQEINGPVSTDSCVEFFFSPYEKHPLKYFNLEINCGGVPLLHYVTVPRKEYLFLDAEQVERIEIAHSMPREVFPELVADTTQRPLLGKGVFPITAGSALESTDVLNYPALLVVGLLEQEAIVLDLCGERRGYREDKSVNGKQ
jgi:hypothetical protein